MTNSTPGLPVNFQANLPVASTMSTALVGRTPFTDATTNKVLPERSVFGK